MKIFQLVIFLFLTLFFISKNKAQTNQEPWVDKFRQMDQEFATPNVYRTASGAPGHEYWQQQADYNIKIRLDDEQQRLFGEETITYYNHSPDELRYLWLQLDQNRFEKESDSKKIGQMGIGEKADVNAITDLEPWFDGGFKLDYVQDATGKKLSYQINKTMMRIDLFQPLKKGGSISFKIKWWYNINDHIRIGGRSGYEYFDEDKNYLYTIAQFYPRMAAYTDYGGWQNKQFLGSGEFTLEFGHFEVAITVPSDHIVAATGELQNAKEVLTTEQQNRLNQARHSNTPILIVTENEAREKEKTKNQTEKTWVFKAKNVRDFAFASSRKFIWDAQAVPIGDKRPLAMSFYPREGNPLWGQFSTRVVAHTLQTYSQHTLDYPYPVAIAVHTKDIGMEYPMISFNGGRPEADGTYSEAQRNAMIYVIIHEVGHNFFPMIINSDERQWTWLDEGLNTFVEYLTEKSWDQHFPTRRGPARNITDYMRSDKSQLSPIMTGSENILQFGNNAYGKPATALNILRETIMGRELFDFAFKEYARRWAFKRPVPEDFFRTMEDASGVDLDWFWRGWFYGIDACDMAIKNVKVFRPETKNSKEKSTLPEDISLVRDREEGIISQVEKDPATHDFYTENATAIKEENTAIHTPVTENEKDILEKKKWYYQVTIENIGGLVMPLIFSFDLADGSQQEIRIPVEIWRLSGKEINKVFVFDQEVKSITLDPFLETADINIENNFWPAKTRPSGFELNSNTLRTPQENPMQRAKKK